MRTRMYGGVRGRKTKVGGKPTFVFLLLDSKLQFLTNFVKIMLRNLRFCCIFVDFYVDTALLYSKTNNPI